MKKFLSLALVLLLSLSICAFAEEAATEETTVEAPENLGTDAGIEAAKEYVAAGTYYWFGNEAANYMLALNGELTITSEEDTVMTFANDAETLYVEIAQVDPEGSTLEDYAAVEGSSLVENGINYVYYEESDENYLAYVVIYMGDDGMEYDLTVSFDQSDATAMADAAVIVASLTAYDASQFTAA